MRRKIFFFVFTVQSLLIGCGGGKTATPDPVNDTTSDKTRSLAETPVPESINKAIKKEEYEAGALLVQHSDCLGCHKTDVKLVGPSYKEIAHKYPMAKNIIDTLIEKIIKGGAGNWGQVPMQPHANLSKEDVRLMVSYIFGLKDN
jgi:cytochrome c